MKGPRVPRCRRGAPGAAVGIAALCLAVAPVLSVENQPAPKQDAPPKLSVLRCGRLLDVRTGGLKEGALVVVRGDRIERILERDAKIPEGAAVVDLTAFTVLPGLVDAHTHTFLQPGDYDVQLLKQSLPRRTLQAAAQARTFLLSGFTTIRDLETEGAMYGDADLRDAIADGLVPGPRMQVATRAISTTGNYALLGYAHEVTVPKGVQIADGPWEIRKAVREQIQNGADWLKFYGDYRTSSAGIKPPSRMLCRPASTRRASPPGSKSPNASCCSKVASATWTISLAEEYRPSVRRFLIISSDSGPMVTCIRAPRY